jgi:hypothetical protein
MPMIRRKAGPEFEAMEFDGSFECAKEIISWMDKAVDSYGAYWSSNNTMTLPELCGDHRQIMSGDWVVKYSSRIDTLNAGCFSDYEMVS